ncbi:MAG: hypothetical protein K2K55_05000 [Duncaniella sp.]|nr:hypothetical protein [Duncaniella sp.]
MPTDIPSKIYRSRWDAATWALIALTLCCSILPLFLDDDGLIPVFVGVLVVAVEILILKSIYYRVDRRGLTVYRLFRPTVYPVDKIYEISRPAGYTPGPATSITRRLAISFSGSSLPSGSNPLVISPLDETSFLRHVMLVNPCITTTLTTPSADSPHHRKASQNADLMTREQFIAAIRQLDTVESVSGKIYRIDVITDRHVLGTRLSTLREFKIDTDGLYRAYRDISTGIIPMTTTALRDYVNRTQSPSLAILTHLLRSR